jgi:hypothetical protein
MFRIHKVFDASTVANRQLISQVQAMLRVQFHGLEERDIAKLPAQLADPMKYRFRSILLVAEDGAGRWSNAADRPDWTLQPLR